MRLVRRERDASDRDYTCGATRRCHGERHILLKRVSLGGWSF